ncbi:MAG: excinuclease ABC subunit UvrC [Bacteriovoracaceae bacterium]|nr:excinuclease ABC subunit UvrC [Bacteriovoracaceae bacterium]
MSPNEQRMPELLAKANSLPKSPGCYLMKDNEDNILYVGKAKSLKARVVSYFNSSAKSAKTMMLVSKIHNFDFILTNSDAESYVLENNLIKDNRPKYNIRLKDDKSYPYVQVNRNHSFPKLDYVRRPKRKKGAELFGPYPSGSNISTVMRTITKAFMLRDCSDWDFSSRKTPCILYQMGQCSAPCVNYISSQDYAKDLENALKVLKGNRNSKKALKLLEDKMFEYAQQEKFEQAAMLRDYIEELKPFLESSFDQKVEFLNERNADVFAYYQGDKELDVTLYMIRQGSLLGHKTFHFYVEDLFDEVSEEIILFMLQYYGQSEEPIPETIVADLDKEQCENLEAALKSTVGGNTRLSVVKGSGKYSTLVEAARNHAEESQRVRIQNQESEFTGLHKLKELLGMSERPRVLECYDIAIWQGKSPTASQVVFHDGKPDKASYRHYHLQELPEGNNDFAMMKEVFERRLKKRPLPDVFIVDGGVAQVNVARKVLAEFNVDVPVAGIAKARDLKKNFRNSSISKSEERLIIPNRSNPYILNKCPSLFRIVVQMRDEAHRFSRRLHHKAEKKRVFKSWIDDVSGIGEKVKKEILQKITTPKEDLAKMNVKELVDLLGIQERYAKALYDFLRTDMDN